MKPTIICHRGFWRIVGEQNTIGAFEGAFERGWGVELDVRDYCGRLVVSHDPPADEFANPELFSAVLDLLGDRPNTLAVNVKSCGLGILFEDLTPPKDWFFFDVGFPELWEYADDLPVYVRHSPDEQLPVTTSYSGVLLDPGDGLVPWFPHLLPPKRLCVVSPECHDGGSEEYRKRWWGWVRECATECSLVTDLPEEAEEFFK